MTTRCSATAQLGAPAWRVTLHCVLPREAHYLVPTFPTDDRWHLAVFRGCGYQWRDDSLNPAKFP